MTGQRTAPHQARDNNPMTTYCGYLTSTTNQRLLVMRGRTKQPLWAKILTVPKWHRSYTTETPHRRARAIQQAPAASRPAPPKRGNGSLMPTSCVHARFTNHVLCALHDLACGTKAHQARTPQCAARPHAPSHDTPRTRHDKQV